MKLFNFPAFLLVCLGSVIPDLLQLLLKYGNRTHLFPYEVRPYLAYASSVPWAGIVFGIFFSVLCRLAFPASTKIRLDEIAGFTLICPLVQFMTPMFAMFASPFLESLNVAPVLLAQLLYAFFLALLAKGILGLEALGMLEILLVAFIGMAATAANFIPGLPFYPIQVWYLLVGGAMGFFSARQMN
ncbi:MAG: hypothetical protein KDD69_06640 [Bdellovibrionales bacterium]|nr:hypothetical protein [Bdellovibrionales bacterium]